MKRGYLLAWIMFYFSITCIAFPVNRAVSGTVSIPYLNCAYAQFSGTHTMGDYSCISSIDVFITNNSNHGCSSAGAIWTHSGTNGSWNLDLPSFGPWYVVFVNYHVSPSVQVTYNISGSTAPIPGFHWLVVAFLLIGLVVIFTLKSNSKLIKYSNKN
ncbi:MAG: hypothetical protein ACTSRS_06545 [Candidatus Helarchaeota archaeon]